MSQVATVASKEGTAPPRSALVLAALILGAIAWIALFGIEREPGRQADFGPALRLVGIVGFLVSATGLLYLRLPAVEQLSAGGGGILGRLIGNEDEATNSDAVTHGRARRIRVTLPDPREFEIDGEGIGKTGEFEVTLQPGAIRVR